MAHHLEAVRGGGELARRVTPPEHWRRSPSTCDVTHRPASGCSPVAGDGRSTRDVQVDQKHNNGAGVRHREAAGRSDDMPGNVTTSRRPA
jgi:hypothetical protein